MNSTVVTIRSTLLCMLICAGVLPTAALAQDWQSLLAEVSTDNPAAGSWSKADDGLRVEPSSGARLLLPAAPKGEYDVRIAFTRVSGVHSIALIFPHGSGQASFEVDAWGAQVGGIQNIGGRSILDNPTRRANVVLTNGRRYTMTVEVRKDRVGALLDDREIAAHRTDGSDLTVPDVWSLPDRASLAIGAWDSQTIFHSIDVRPVNGAAPIQIVRAANPPARPAQQPQAPPPPPAQPAAAAPTELTPEARARLANKRVLLVIANNDFFYREYNDPKTEMERAGIRVTVAAGRREQSTPHGGSGQSAGPGVVTPDIALADVRSQDYDAILFSGGWGASQYQFAFEGRYNNPQYNGDRAIKATVNRLIGEFVHQDKYVAALCNGVTVLAWARVDGQSPLRGKRVCAPTRQAAAGIYNGRQDQPSCRWHPEANGAIMSPAGVIGRPGTAEDDVCVDGKIITGEDDISAREMGRTLVRLLAQE